MSLELEKEIKSSNILNLYKKIQKLSKWVKVFKWIAGIVFTIGLLDILIFNTTHTWVAWVIFVVWLPGLTFAFFGGIIHFLAGKKLESISKKYNINMDVLMNKLS
jgi:hypothetical protein